MMEPTLLENIKGSLIKYRKRYALAFLAVLVSNLLLVINPLLLKAALTSQRQAPLKWAFILLFVAATSAVFKYWMRCIFVSISREIEKEVRSQLFDRLQNQSKAFYDRYGIGELLSRLTNDISAYREVLGPGVMYPTYLITMLLPGYATLFWISKPLALLSFFPLLMIPLFHKVVRHQIYALSKELQESLGKVSNLVQEQYSGIRIIKAFVAEKTLVNQFFLESARLAKVSFNLFFAQGMIFPFFNFIAKTTTLLLVAVSGVIFLTKAFSLNASDFVSFMWIQSYILLPILMLGWVLPIYERGKAAYERLREMERELIEVAEGGQGSLPMPMKCSVECCHLSFSYAKSKRVILENVSFKIAAGSFVGITGPLGSGKSTLFRLLNREYEVEPKSILINGIDIHEYSLKAFRQAVVCVEQIPFLFSKTIAQNVHFDKERISDEALDEVLKQADLLDTVLDFPLKYNTIVGERGVLLSGGQKQRVAMARAFLVDRSIVLLDDVFSAVDAETELKIFTSIKRRFKGKTVLLITHRAKILKQMDQILYFQEGRLIEQGAPEKLKEQGSHFAALLDLQRME